MAFATSQVKVESTGSHWRTTGKWTGAIGDAGGTISVPGMEVTDAAFEQNLSSGGPGEHPATSWTASAGVAWTCWRRTSSI